jgi:hypothetical protein
VIDAFAGSMASEVAVPLTFPEAPTLLRRPPTEPGIADGDLRAFVQANAPLPAPKAVLFAAELAERMAWLHAEGRSVGPLDRGVQATSVDGQARPVLAGPGQPDASGGAEDVFAVGVLLTALLGALPPTPAGPPPRPDAVPEGVWPVVLGCLDRDPAARPTAAVLARQLRDVGRDLLLGLGQSPVAGPSGVATAPGFVPGPLDDAAEPEPPAARDSHGRRRLLLVSAAVAVVVLGGVVALALAGSTPDAPGATTTTGAPPQAEPAEVCVDEGCAARAEFRPAEKQVVACDNQRDGFSAVAVYTRADREGESTVWASSGNGTCAEDAVDLPAGTEVTLKACTGDRPTDRIVSCSDAVIGTA